MRALFFKEIRQGKFILLFGPALVLLLAMLRAVLPNFLPLATPRDLDAALFNFAVVGAFLIALLAGAGLFASEVDRGTMPVLLGLPLSRARIWLTKTLAGLVIALIAALLLLLPAYFIFKQTRSAEFLFNAYCLTMLWFTVFFLSVLCSTLLEHVVSAFMAAILLFGGLLFLSVMTTAIWGGLLLGYDPMLDACLWLLALIPCLLLASLFAFLKGDLLRGRRKWFVAVPVFLLSSALVVSIISGAFHYALRYQRTKVEAVYPLSGAWNGRTLNLDAMRSPVRWQMTSNIWTERQSAYRSHSLVMLDLKRGRELLVSRGGAGAVSADGNLAALTAAPFTLTWGDYLPEKSSLEVWDLKEAKQLHEIPISKLAKRLNLYTFWPSSVSWAPKSDWLALGEYSRKLIAMRSDGSDAVNLSFLSRQAWDWELSGAGIYGFTGSAELRHCSLPGARSTLVWAPVSTVQLPKQHRWWRGVLSVSPDGNWIALQIFSNLENRQQAPDPKPVHLLADFVIRADGKQAFLLHQRLGGWAGDFENPKFTWSKDSKQLFFITSKAKKETELLRWNAGESAPVVLPWAKGHTIKKMCLLPSSGDLLVWSLAGVYLVNEQGAIKPLPNRKIAHLSWESSLLGIDQAGRAIISVATEEHNSIRAVNLSTGAIQQLYP